MKIRCMALLLAAAVLLGAAPAVQAAPGEGVDTDWYQAEASSFALETGAELAGLARLVNGGTDFQGKTVTLAADVALTGPWTPIGTGEHPFRGSFDGCGHTVTGLRLEAVAGVTEYGLFGRVEGGTLEDFVLSAPSAEVTADVGSQYWAVGTAAGHVRSAELREIRVEDARLSAEVDSAAAVVLGGLAGLADYGETKASGTPSAIGDCAVDGAEIRWDGAATYHISAGGLLGGQGKILPDRAAIGIGSPAVLYGWDTEVAGCTVDGLTTARDSGGSQSSPLEAVGGLIGYARSGGSVADCAAAGLDISAVAQVPEPADAGRWSDTQVNGIYAGGLAGAVDGGMEITGCSAAGAMAADVTGGYQAKLKAGERGICAGGFFGGLAGLVGSLPDTDSWQEQGYTGDGASFRNCWTDLTMTRKHSEALRYGAGLMATDDGRHTSFVNLFALQELPDMDYSSDYPVVVPAYGSLGEEAHIHLVTALDAQVGVAAEPATYGITHAGVRYDSITNGSNWHDEMSDFARTYTAGSVTGSKLAFPSPGLQTVTVALVRGGDRITFPLPVAVYGPAATPQAEIDYEAETLTGLSPGVSYAVGGQTCAADGDGAIRLEESWLGGTLEIVRKAAGGYETDDSLPQTVILPARPSSPAVTAADGSLTGTDATMEYRPEGNGSWTPVTGPVEGLAPGRYEVRVSASNAEQRFRGPAALVEVTAAVPSVRRYTIRAEADGGGTVTPAGDVRVTRGGRQTFRMAPSDGWVLADVVVDGVSVGAVDEYTFSDVRSDHAITAYFAEDVAAPSDTGVDRWLVTDVHRAYLRGYPDGRFRPEAALTRAEAAQIFYSLLRDRDTAQKVTFTDVPSDQWYAAAVETLAALGIVEGVGGGRFDPERPVTRAELAAMAVRFADRTEAGACPFPDVAEDDWFREDVTVAAAYGWLRGYPDGGFHPNDPVRRSETASVVNRMLGRAPDRAWIRANSAQLRLFPDVLPVHWAYYQIHEAADGHRHSSLPAGERWTGLL